MNRNGDTLESVGYIIGVQRVHDLLTKSRHGGEVAWLWFRKTWMIRAVKN